MPRYANLSGTSAVVAYEVAPHAITVHFKDGHAYLYTDGSAGAPHIAEMKRLAAAGQGLATFISQVVRMGYAKKLR